ncbi:insulinase family protein, partial [Albidovulum sp.]|uniref:insulinase family protein n=1 Tax=Albidovulum sp. TaxID=1872424 RepID=UPI003D7E5535
RRGNPPNHFAEMPMRSGVTVITEELEIAKSYFFFALEGPKMSSPDYLPFEVLMHYIGGNSQTALLHDMLVKRRSVLQKVLATPLRRRFGKGWQPITGEGEPEKIATGVDSLLEILGQLRARGVSPESLSLCRFLGRRLTTTGVATRCCTRRRRSVNERNRGWVLRRLNGHYGDLLLGSELVVCRKVPSLRLEPV